MMLQERVRPTLKRTKFACVNCKAAKAACDSNRPCAWCIRHALQDSCVDAPRKVRTSKKICCDPSLHAKTVTYKQEHTKGDYQLGPTADFTPSTAIPVVGPPLSPPTDIFPIEDLLIPSSFDFGTNNGTQPCTNCPLYLTCAKDAPQRLICATSSSPPQSPLTTDGDDDYSPPSTSSPSTSGFTLPPISLATHPEFSLQLPSVSKSTQLDGFALSPQLSQISPQQHVHTSPHQQLSPLTPLTPLTPITPPPPTPTPLTPSQVITSSPVQQVITTPSTTVTVQPRNLSGCCSFATSPHLPPLLDDICNCQSLVQREMAKINASLETISALMQLQNGPLIPTATFRLPDTSIEDCNDEFAKALGYENRDDLLAASTVESITITTSQLLRSLEETNSTDDEDSKPTKIKPPLVALLPEKWGPGLLKCANDLQKATVPVVNQMVFTTKRGDPRYFTVLIKPCGWFAYISLLKQHTQKVEGIIMCGE